MNIEDVRAFCMSLPHTTEDLPFDEHTLAIRVAGKIFTLIPLDNPGRMNLKCDPEKAILLREEYTAIQPGYHMNKKMWNTVHYDQLPAALIQELIVDSYKLIIAGLPKKTQQVING
jgi:predicted DNA-binding protein (MmcQ/YjbR family)